MNEIYSIPERVYRETEQHAADVQEYLDGHLSEDLFKSRRVPRGIYGQRQEGLYMVRVRVAGATLRVPQIQRLAELSKLYGNGTLHVTTRQDVQLHEVYIEDTPEVLNQLLEVGLTPAGGGGNTIRNITTCSHGGVGPEEVFDPRPYAVAATDYFLQFDSSYHMPRKLKIAFSGCASDCALAGINDVGFIARIQNGEPGFTVFIGGGLGTHSRPADLFADFIPARDTLRMVEAVKRMFDRYGDRRNRHRARLRFAIERLGTSQFYQELQEEYTTISHEEVPDAVPVDLVPALPQPKNTGNGRTPDSGYDAWRKRTVKPQKQDGYAAVEILLERGDISAQDFTYLSVLSEKYGAGEIRTDRRQRLLLPYIQEAALPLIYKNLQKFSGKVTGTNPAARMVACKGAATCRLGLCRSQDLIAAIGTAIREADIDPGVLSEVELHTSGCPNNCGQHAIAQLGFYGGARRKNGRSYPVYHLVGGAQSSEDGMQLAATVTDLPARNIPEFLVEILRDYEHSPARRQGFNAYWHARGKLFAKEAAKQYQRVPAPDQEPAFYRDWGILEDFSLADRGSGECGAGVIELVATELQKAERLWRRANKARERSETENENLGKTVLTAAGALLLTLGHEPKDPEQVIQLFKQAFLDSGVGDPENRLLLEQVRSTLQGESVALGSHAEEVRRFLDHAQDLFDRMDASLNFK